MEVIHTMVQSMARSLLRLWGQIKVLPAFLHRVIRLRGLSPIISLRRKILLSSLVVISACGGGGLDNTPQSVDILSEFRSENMPYGFRVVGNSGSVQVDGNYVNLALAQSGTINVPASASGVEITAYGLNTPMMCIQTISGGAVVVSSNNSLPNVTYRFTSYESSAVIKWFIFDKTVPASTGYGLNVYDAGGGVTFSSDWSVMRIGAVGKVPDFSDADAVFPPLQVNAPYAGQWAACVTSVRVGIDSGGGSRVARIHVDGVLTGANYAVVQDTIVGLFPTDGMPIVAQPVGGSLILVDVTGY